MNFKDLKIQVYNIMKEINKIWSMNTKMNWIWKNMKFTQNWRKCIAKSNSQTYFKIEHKFIWRIQQNKDISNEDQQKHSLCRV